MKSFCLPVGIVGGNSIASFIEADGLDLAAGQNPSFRRLLVMTMPTAVEEGKKNNHLTEYLANREAGYVTLFGVLSRRLRELASIELNNDLPVDEHLNNEHSNQSMPEETAVFGCSWGFELVNQMYCSFVSENKASYIKMPVDIKNDDVHNLELYIRETLQTKLKFDRALLCKEISKQASQVIAEYESKQSEPTPSRQLPIIHDFESSSSSEDDVEDKRRRIEQ